MTNIKKLIFILFGVLLLASNPVLAQYEVQSCYGYSRYECQCFRDPYYRCVYYPPYERHDNRYYNNDAAALSVIVPLLLYSTQNWGDNNRRDGHHHRGKHHGGKHRR